MKNLNKNIFPIMLLLLQAVACSSTSPEGEQEKKDKGSSTVSGVISNAVGKSLILQEVKSQSMVGLDTLLLDEDGEYEFEFAPPVTGFYRLTVDDRNAFFLIVSAGDDIVASGDGTNLFKTYTVSGSKESQRLKELNGILAQRDSINMVLQQAQATQNQALFQEALATYDGILYEVDRDVKNFINREPATLSSLAALQNLNFDADFAYFDQVIKALDGKANGNEIYDMMKSQIEQMRKLAVGSKAPEIDLPQPNGEHLKLSDLRGKYVLIDFWASWCGPCRRENPNVKRVYEKYHGKGFDILGVSLDKSQQAWLTAIEQDGLQWHHVSDLKYWQSAVVPEYQIQGIPLTFLVDKEGTIIAKNLRGPALENKLAELFGE